MDRTSTSHRRLGVAALIASLALGAGLSGCSSPSASAHTHDAVAAAAAVPQPNSASVPAQQLGLRQTMRALWEQHMEWTRLAIVDFVNGSAGFDTTAGRLLQNQTDIGNAIRPFYGDAAAGRLTTLLKAHITDFVAFFEAAKGGDPVAIASTQAAVYENAQQIGDFLASANPKSWPQDTMRSMMKEHIDQTVAYGGDELTGRYADGITVYDQAEAHMLMMADLLSQGIIAQFPGKFQ